MSKLVSLLRTQVLCEFQNQFNTHPFKNLFVAGGHVAWGSGPTHPGSALLLDSIVTKPSRLQVPVKEMGLITAPALLADWWTGGRGKPPKGGQDAACVRNKKRARAGSPREQVRGLLRVLAELTRRGFYSRGI